MPPAKTKTSVGLETPEETLARSKKMTATMMTPEVSAADLANPPAPVNITTPQVSTVPKRSVTVDNVVNETNNIIQANTEEAQQLKQARAERDAFGLNDSLSSFANDIYDQYDMPQNIKELKDINLRLAGMAEQSALNKVDIEGAPGQTLGQAGREVTQEDREAAVRSAGLAARAAVLQGNIETAQSLARDAVTMEYQDRQLELQNRTAQINDLRDVVDGQTQQLLDAELREIEKENARIEEVKTAVATAMVSGASSAEVGQLNSNLPDDQKLALAQSIIARNATENIGLDRQVQRAQLANINSQIASRGLSDSLAIRSQELDERMALMELAGAGDPDAVAALGYDPNALPGGADAALQYEQANAELQNDIDVMSSLLANNRGLDASTGAVRSAALQGFFRGGKAEGVGTLTRFTPVIGNIQGAAQSINDKQDFLSGLSYLVNSTTFQEIIDMRANGVTFGNMTEGERIAAGRAANELNAAMSVGDDGQVSKVNASEEKTRRMINDIMVAYMAKQEDLRANTFLTPEENDEINAIYNQ